MSKFGGSNVVEISSATRGGQHIEDLRFGGQGGDPPRDGGGGGSTMPPMDDHRLRHVEQAVVRIDGRLDSIDGSLARIESSVSTWKWQVLGGGLAVLLATIFAVIGTGLATQQMTVATFQAAGQQAQQAQQAQPPAPAPPTIIYLPTAPPAPAASR